MGHDWVTNTYTFTFTPGTVPKSIDGLSSSPTAHWGPPLVGPRAGPWGGAAHFGWGRSWEKQHRSRVTGLPLHLPSSGRCWVVGTASGMNTWSKKATSCGRNTQPFSDRRGGEARGRPGHCGQGGSLLRLQEKLSIV